MTNIEDRELYTKGPQFIKPNGMFFGVAKAGKGEDVLETSKQGARLTAGERAFLDDCAR